MARAAVVEAVGAGVTDVKVGDRVAWTTGPLGTYAEVKLHTAERLVKLPDAISFEQGAAVGGDRRVLARRVIAPAPEERRQHVIVIRRALPAADRTERLRGRSWFRQRWLRAACS